jgi:hypothetical protein
MGGFLPILGGFLRASGRFWRSWRCSQIDITTQKGGQKREKGHFEGHVPVWKGPQEEKTGQNQGSGRVEKTPEPSRALKLARAAARATPSHPERRKDPRALTGVETSRRRHSSNRAISVEKTPEPSRALKRQLLSWTPRDFTVEKTPEPSRALKPIAGCPCPCPSVPLVEKTPEPSRALKRQRIENG